jgi:Ca2+-transporting ATPase
MLFLTCSISFLAQVSLIYLPFMQGVFQTEPLSAVDFGTVLGWGALSMSLHEARRIYERHTMRQEEKEERRLMDEGPLQ